MRPFVLALAFVLPAAAAAQDRNDAVYRYRGADRDACLLERARHGQIRLHDGRSGGVDEQDKWVKEWERFFLQK